MKISLKWLKEYIDLEGIAVNEIAHRLTMAGLEVESVDDQVGKLNGFVVAEVMTKEKHPNAKKLSLCTVNDGKAIHQVVCGAPNVAAGQKVIMATIGTVIPENGMVISKVNLRGVESNGMLCSERELQLSDDHEGIIVLDPHWQNGTPASDVFGLNDCIFEIGITPNRPDALSHVGVARDLAALLNMPLRKPELRSQLKNSDEVNKYAQIIIEDFENCPRYSAMIVRGVEIKESPAWLKKRIEAVGLRPINNIVDVTNFILHELGQPLHAFDLDMLADHTIIVKRANEGEEFITLDSKSRKLNSNCLMICDGARSVAVGGVLGGENSEVTTNTKNILIESAYFNPRSIRKTSKFLGLSTDSSYRFERGTNPEQTLFAAQRAAELMVEVGGGEIVEGYIDVVDQNILTSRRTFLRYSELQRILGYHIPEDAVREILINLGFSIEGSADQLEISIPHFRPDIEREIDLIEEIARIFGYDNIPMIENISVPMIELVDESKFLDEIRDFFTSAGFYEIITNSLTNLHLPHLQGQAIALLNPQSADMSHLRTSLLPGLLATLQKNINTGTKNVKLFEAGHIFYRTSDIINSFNDFVEVEKVAGIISGNAADKSWYSSERLFDIYDLKGIIDRFAVRFKLTKLLSMEYSKDADAVFEYHMSLRIGTDGVLTIGKILPELRNSFGIEQEVFYFEIDINSLKKVSAPERTFTELAKFPKVHRDLAFVISDDLDTGRIIDFIKEQSSELLQEVKLFDVFKSESLGAGKKSAAFSLVFASDERTLTDEEVEKEFTSLIGSITKKFNAMLRG